MPYGVKLDRRNWSKIQWDEGLPDGDTKGVIYLNRSNGDLYVKKSDGVWEKVNVASGTGDDTFESCYDNDSLERTINVDDGDISFDIDGGYNIEIDLTNATGANGFVVYDDTDYFRVLKHVDASLTLTADLETIGINAASTVSIIGNHTMSIAAGASHDLALGARGSSTNFNQSGDESLSGFTKNSVVGGMNELMTLVGGVSAPEFDDCYDNGSGSRNITIDDGDIGWYVSGNNTFGINIAGSDSGYGIVVINGADNFKLLSDGAGLIDLNSDLQSMDVSCSEACTIGAGASHDLTFGARGSTLPFNQTGEESLYGDWTAASVIGCFNELKSDVSTIQFDDCYDNGSGTRNITVDNGSVSWNCSGTSEFLIDINSCDYTYGFKVLDGSDYFHVVRQAESSLRTEAELLSFYINASTTGILQTAQTFTVQSTTGDLRLSGRGAAYTTFNDASNLVLSGFSVNSVIGAFNELMTDKVEGPASATDTAIASFDGTTGNLIQNTGATATPAGVITGTQLRGDHSSGDDTSCLVLINTGSNSGTSHFYVGSRNPENDVSQYEGSLYICTNTTDWESAVYQKMAGSGNTGWRRFAMAPCPANLVNNTCAGDIIEANVDVNSFGQWATLFMASDGNLEAANADTSSTMQVVGLAVESGTGLKKVLLRGFVKNDSWSWNKGADLFASTTTGDITETAPTGSWDCQQYIGKAWTETIIYFNPDLTYDVIEPPS